MLTLHSNFQQSLSERSFEASSLQNPGLFIPAWQQRLRLHIQPLSVGGNGAKSHNPLF